MNESLFNRFVNKTVSFKFNHQLSRFQLSQSLFSSANVDDGSRLLLKSILQQIDLASISSVLDVGCGVGVLGISLVNGRQQTTLTVQDRDALALAFTWANAALNGVDTLEVVPGLGFQHLNGRRFDLIVSNLPGKAGEPVLQAMLHQMPGYLAENGFAAIVIVKPLAELIVNTLNEMGSDILFQTASSMHAIFIFQGGEAPTSEPDFPGAYLRSRHPFQADKISYTLDTVYNLPDFDNQGYETRLALKMLDKETINGRVLFWNPGQGHLPVVTGLQNKIAAMALGSRDSLSLQTSAHNLQANNLTTEITSHHCPTLLDIDAENCFDNLIIFPDDDPGVPWSHLLPNAFTRLLKPEGKGLLIAKSGFIGRFLTEREGLRPLRQKKYHGLRAVWLAKAGD